MAVINHATKEVTFKIVYCGTPMGGKTTNLQYIHSRIENGQRGDLVSLATSTDRTLYFDFLPINTVVINGYKTKFMLYTVPGQVCYNATRQLVLKGVDGIVFVADSTPSAMEINVQSLRTLMKNLQDNGTPMEQLAVAFQYNKRDLPDAVPLAYLEYLLNNGTEKRPWFEASANTGWQVFTTLNNVAEQILTKFHRATGTPPTAQSTLDTSRSTTPAASPPGSTRSVSPPNHTTTH